MSIIASPKPTFSKIPGSPIAYWASKKAVVLFEENDTLQEFRPR